MENYGNIDSKFRLAIIAAKRAKQLINGSKKKVDLKAENPLTIALEEIRQGKVTIEILNKDYYENEELDINEDESSMNEEKKNIQKELS